MNGGVDAVLSLEDVCKALGGIGRCTLHRWSQSGLFPIIRRIGPARVGVIQSELNEWLRSRPAARDTKRPRKRAA
jgi:predicted DNA-binding transcriptional regulator AlpA